MRTIPALLTYSVLLLLLPAISCNSDSVQITDFNYEMTDWSDIHPDCMTDEVPCVSLNFIYPEFEGRTGLTDSLRTWTGHKIFGPEVDPAISDPFIEEARKLAREWFSDYDEYTESIEDYHIPWVLERRIEVIYQSNNIVSLHYNEFSFTGGTHPLQIDVFQSFDESGGSQITLQDLTYDETHYLRLKDMAEEQFRFTYELLEDDDLKAAGFRFLDGEFNLPENFAFTEFGILFYFNVYEVAPFATRPIAIELPYSDMKNIVRSRWLKYEEQFTYR